MRKLTLLVLLFAIQTLCNLPAKTYSAANNSKILVLYKERDTAHQGLIAIYTRFLKQAGYEFDTRDVEKLLVEKTEMSPYFGILTCYQTNQMVGGDIYPHWLVEQMEAGRRILIVQTYGAFQALLKKPNGSFIEWNESTHTLNTFFYPFGLEFYFAFTGDKNKIRLITADKQYAQYQIPIAKKKGLTHYELFKSVNPKNKIYFELERADMVDSRSALNVITPFGGMIHQAYPVYWDSRKKKNLFRVNFTKFIKEVFSAKSPSVPKYQIKTHDELIKHNPLPNRPPPITGFSKKRHELSRRVLVPYKKSEVHSLEEHPLYNRGTVVLEYLGCAVDYRAVEEGLPDDNEMKNYLGIVTWNTSPYMVEAEKYGKWLLHQIKRGKRVAILQEYGATFDLKTQKPSEKQVEVFKEFGIRFQRRGETREEYLPQVRLVNKEVLSFEREFDLTFADYENTYTSLDSRHEVFLSISDREFGNVDLGIIFPQGGICLGRSPFYFPPHDEKRIKLIRKSLAGLVAPEIAEQVTLGSWFLDPYWFFNEALDLKSLPAADLTTMNGSRIFYAHIDGDGLDSISLIDSTHFAGNYIYEEILKKYSDIPTTVSVISKFVERAGNEYHHPVVELSRAIYSLPNVDVAVHAATHPFDWVGGDPYIINPDEYPYQVGYKPQDLLTEIWGAKLFVEHNLIPPHKKCETLLWSGATNPDAKALEICWRAGMHNLNGGDPRFDVEYPSITGVCPYTTPFGSYRQYLTSAQNDYIYTLFMTGDWEGQKKVLQHFERTDKPFRFYPMNLYYHFYSGIRNKSLDALRTIYDYVRSIDVASMFATQYCEIAEDYYNTRIGFDGQAYWVENNGYLRTIRFKKKVHVDVRRSDGVIGYSYNGDQTYIHLDGSKHRKIVLAGTVPKIPYVIRATQFIDKSSFDGSQLSLICRGFGKTVLKFGGLKPNRTYRLTLQAPGRARINVEVKANSEGIGEYRTHLAAPATSYQTVLKM